MMFKMIFQGSKIDLGSSSLHWPCLDFRVCQVWDCSQTSVFSTCENGKRLVLGPFEIILIDLQRQWILFVFYVLHLKGM